LLCCVERGALVNGLVAGEGARGRGLFATHNVEAGHLLLRVPLALGLREPHEPPPSLARENWYSRLAFALLQERALGDSSPFAEYLATLPEHVAGTPLLDDEAMCKSWPYPPAYRYAAEMRQEVTGAFERLSAQLVCTELRFSEAVAVVLSRAYRIAPDKFMLIPAADLLNDGGESAVNCRWELCDDTIAVSSTRPLCAGAEALISYGHQRSESFWIFYGFVGCDSPHDDVVLFESLGHLRAWHAARKGAECDNAAVEWSPERQLRLRADGRLDVRMLDALTALSGDAMADVRLRCLEIKCALEAGMVGGPSDALLVQKHRILCRLLASNAGAGASPPVFLPGSSELAL